MVAERAKAPQVEAAWGKLMCPPEVAISGDPVPQKAAKLLLTGPPNTVPLRLTLFWAPPNPGSRITYDSISYLVSTVGTAELWFGCCDALPGIQMLP